MTPTLSLVTGTLNRPESFARLVSSIVEHTSVEWELVVSDASDEPLSCAYPGVRFIREVPRAGHSRGYNRAFRECRGEWIVWINDDAEVVEGYDVAAIRFMEAQPKIGLGALHYSEDGSDFHVNEAYGCIYANFGIFRRSLGEKVGFFDESIEMYGTDNAFSFRILLADYGIADIPNARIIHHSVKDKIRAENQRNRMRDNQALSVAYMPMKAHWQAAYLKHRVPSSTVPWSHGVKPQAVHP